MKTKNLFLSLAFIVTLASCSKEADLTPKATVAQTNSDFKIEDGAIKFKSMEAYSRTYDRLTSATEEELSNWNKQLPFKTLETDYLTKRNDSSLSFELANDSTIKDKSYYHPSLYRVANSKGIFWCGDTIMKVKDEFLYIITNGDLSAIDKIDNNEDVSNIKSIIRIQHIKSFLNSMQKVAGLITETENAHQLKYRTYTKSYSIKYWYGTVNKKEYVTMDAKLLKRGTYKDASGNTKTYTWDGIYFELTNWVIGFPTNGLSPFQYGQITVTGTLSGQPILEFTSRDVNRNTIGKQINMEPNENFDFYVKWDYLSNRGISGPTNINYYWGGDKWTFTAK
jgi:hypothetical protein